TVDRIRSAGVVFLRLANLRRQFYRPRDRLVRRPVRLHCAHSAARIGGMAMGISNWNKLVGVLFVIAAGLILVTPRSSTTTALAQTASQSASAAGDVDSQLDPYQRSGLIYYNKLMGKSGWERGQHIYYLKCWICHNEYAIASDPKGAAPT